MGSYTAQQSDLDNNGIDYQGNPDGDGDIDNKASVVSDQIPVAQTDDAVVPIMQNPLIDIVKSGAFQDKNNNGFADVGETISYEFKVTNTGNVTLTDIVVEDPLVDVTGTIASLAPGDMDNTTISGTYVITLADIDTEKKDNTATVRGEAPGGDPNAPARYLRLSGWRTTCGSSSANTMRRPAMAGQQRSCIAPSTSKIVRVMRRAARSASFSSVPTSTCRSVRCT